MLCLDSTLLMLLKFGPTKDNKASDFGSFIGVSYLRDSTTGLPVPVAVLFQRTTGEFQFS
jgi:hypothetical protein